MGDEHQGICQICLRIDKLVHTIKHSVLTRFYNEIICKNASDSDLYSEIPQCCVECEHRLRKTYNFKEKCILANKILDGWRKIKHGPKEPLHSIHKYLSQSSLEHWAPETNYIFYCQEGQSEPIDRTKLCEKLSKSNVKTSESNTKLKRSVSLNVVKKKHNLEEHLDNVDGRSNVSEETEASHQRVQRGKVPVLCFANISPSKKHKEVNLANDQFDKNKDSNESDNALLSKDDTKSDEKNESDFTYMSDNEYLSEPSYQNDCEEMLESPSKTSQSLPSVNNSNNELSDADDAKKNGKKLKRKIKSDMVVKTTKVLSIYEMKNKKFRKESLKELLTKMFAASGELKAKDGTVINKDSILSVIDNKLSETRMKTLWALIYGKKTIPSPALSYLKSIQNNIIPPEYESVFNIEYLNTEKEMVREFRNRKTYKWYVDAKYKCEMCYRGFTTENQFLVHQKRHDESTGSALCDICKKRYPDKSRLYFHRLFHEIIFKCKLCPMTTMYKEVMINHYRHHKGVEYRCRLCDATFKSKSTFAAHSNDNCRGAPLVCTDCGRAFLNKSLLNIHRARLHKDEPPTAADNGSTCPHCSLRFSSERALERHCYISHDKRRDSKGTRTSKEPRDVQSVEAIAPPIAKTTRSVLRACRLCNQVFKSNYWLKYHFRAVHPQMDMETLYPDLKKHLCHLCGKGFRYNFYLKEHMDKHEGKRPFACTECPKSFQHPWGLTYHMSYHRPPEHGCKICGKMFKTSINMVSHMRIHANERTYKCHICSKAFNHASSLTEHFRGVHQKIRRVHKKRVANEKIEETVLYSENESDGNNDASSDANYLVFDNSKGGDDVDD